MKIHGLYDNKTWPLGKGVHVANTSVNETKFKLPASSVQRAQDKSSDSSRLSVQIDVFSVDVPSLQHRVYSFVFEMQNIRRSIGSNRHISRSLLKLILPSVGILAPIEQPYSL